MTVQVGNADAAAAGVALDAAFTGIARLEKIFDPRSPTSGLRRLAARSGGEPVVGGAGARRLSAASIDGPYVLEVLDDDAGDEAPTTVLDLTADAPEVIRWGALRPEAFREHVGIDLS